jgi:phage shock protein PspC (stress-responsive transcriptional regulator)
MECFMTIAGSILARDDTLLGVCHGLGEDFGFSPTWLRLLFAAMLFWSPSLAIGGYAVLGAVVGLSRLIAPNPNPAPAEAEPAWVEEHEREELRLAA